MDLEHDDEKRNLNFVQVDRRVMSALRELTASSPSASIVLSVLTEYMDRTNGIVISYGALQEITGYSRASIGNAIKKLKAESWIQAVRVGTANVYVVNSAAFWSADRKGKYYSRFHATVVASASEQAVAVEKLNSVKLKQTPQAKGSERMTLGNEQLPPPDQQDMELD